MLIALCVVWFRKCNISTCHTTSREVWWWTFQYQNECVVRHVCYEKRVCGDVNSLQGVTTCAVNLALYVVSIRWFAWTSLGPKMRWVHDYLDLKPRQQNVLRSNINGFQNNGISTWSEKETVLHIIWIVVETVLGLHARWRPNQVRAVVPQSVTICLEHAWESVGKES